MALQLTGAFKRDALANLQVRLPAVVIGGGLTAIDTATELLAYYPVQVEKTLERFEALVAEFGEEEVCAALRRGGARDRSKSSLAHGRAVRAERERARRVRARRRTSCRSCARGAASRIVYRKRLIDSPAYRLNHEEVAKALEEGIRFIENMSPAEAVPDEHGAVAAIVFERMTRDAATASGRARRDGRAARAHGLRRRRHEPEHDLRARAPRHLRARRRKEFFAPHRVETSRRRQVSRSSPRRRASAASSRPTRTAGASSLTTATTTRLRRQRRQGDGVREGRLPPGRRALRRRGRGAQGRRAARARRGLRAADRDARRRTSSRASSGSSA